MPRAFEEPKRVVISSAIIRGCRIVYVNTFDGLPIIRTDKTGDREIRLTPKLTEEIADPMDQRRIPSVDVRVIHLKVGNKHKWELEVVKTSPEPFYDTI